MHQTTRQCHPNDKLKKENIAGVMDEIECVQNKISHTKETKKTSGRKNQRESGQANVKLYQPSI